MKAWVLGGVAAMGLTAGSAMAEGPSVAADIAPVQSLVAQVMQGVGAPELLIPQGVSPHGYTMRPSEAQALQAADVVFWIGPMLTPGLDESFETLAPEAVKVALAEVEGMTHLAFREMAGFDADEDHIETKTDSNMGENDHDHEDDGHDDHDDHDDHGHDDHEDHADHEEHDDHGHDHAGGMDPHVWLDPENGRAMLAAIADTLAEVDPANAETYRANAEAARADLAGLITQVRAGLEPVQGKAFVVFHDAYHYFENRFGLTGAGALLKSDASAPSAARLREIEHIMQDRGVVCAFSEPQFNDKIIRTIAGDARIAELDPIGVTQEVGPGLYGAVLGQMGDAFRQCLGE
ncbi:MAG: zinc ABC transporter substrate-binding protein [Rhodobacteraceae bacterium]|nr:zinc ABC transporter substrate-binding protein [Paracoccaceae bacterium]